MKKILVFAGCCAALSMMALGDRGGAMGARSERHPLQKKLIVHAGKGYGAPENTLPAFKAAIATGFGF